MPRQPRTIAADIIDAPSTTAITPEQQQADAAIIATQNALAAAEGNARSLARQLGYDGSLTPGALEDEIRFYQRRTVECLLECGKRMLLLKELTPHGEFVQRVEMLGFSYRTAARFMQATLKTLKSANLALLTSQVKSQSAFLELVTHDDDADIEAVAQLDDIERMSASQLRAALREAKAEREAQDRRLDAKQRRIDALEHEAERQRAAPQDEAHAARAQRIDDFKHDGRASADDVRTHTTGLRRELVRITDYFGQDPHAIPTALRIEMRAWVQGCIAILRELLEDFALDGALDDDEIRADIAAAMAFSSEGAADESAAAA